VPALVAVGLTACVAASDDATLSRRQALNGEACAGEFDCARIDGSAVEVAGAAGYELVMGSGGMGGGTAGDGFGGSAGSNAAGGAGGGDDKEVDPTAIKEVIDCLNKKAKDGKLAPADAVSCFKDKGCKYQLVMSVKSLHISCYAADQNKKCELPRVILHCGKDPNAVLAGFNLCPIDPNHVEVSQQVTADPGRLFAMSQFRFPQEKDSTRKLDDVLKKERFVGSPNGCFGGTCHASHDSPKIAGGGVAFSDKVPAADSVPETQTLEEVCECLKNAKFDEVIPYTEPKSSGNPSSPVDPKTNIDVVRALCEEILKPKFEKRAAPK